MIPVLAPSIPFWRCVYCDRTDQPDGLDRCRGCGAVREVAMVVGWFARTPRPRLTARQRIHGKHYHWGRPLEPVKDVA